MPVEPTDGAAAERRADEALLRLFWNRAELKKEFARLRDERAQLEARIRQQEGQLLRAQQRLEQLESRLANPEQAVQVAVYYQLRALWHYGRRRIARLVRDLSQRELNDEQRARLDEFARTQAAELRELDGRIDQLRGRARAGRQLLLDLRQRYAGWRGLLMPGRAQREIEAARAGLATVVAELERYQSLRVLRAGERLTAESQLSVAGRRRVNLAAIAMAQELFLHFADGDIAARARESSARQLKDANFGHSADCRRLSRLAARRLHELEALAALPAMVERRARYLARLAEYRSESDTVPVAASVAVVPRRISATLEPAGDELLDADVLSQEYWDLYSLLVP
ncbi:MAG: hypothetical protein D6727_00590 [Gammaproteobacteria bacterium]|nr:MAG: hypothetical protein D6727_00590 [Gammaproteobacteria bacterium]